jgi:hypothetical protein
VLLFGLSLGACNLYRCETEARSAGYAGRLGQAVASASDLAGGDSGRVEVLLNEWRGWDSQQSVIALVNIRGFVPAVSEIHVHEGTPATPGRLLWKTANGWQVGDSIWNSSRDLYPGPASWDDFWKALDEHRAYFEVHSPSGASVTGGLMQTSTSPYSPACT